MRVQTKILLEKLYIPLTGNECGRKPIATYVISKLATRCSGVHVVVAEENDAR